MEVRRTAFPRIEERIRPILDAFLAEVRLVTGDDYFPPKPYYQTWVAGARDLVEVFGGDPWLFMPWAFKKHMKTFPEGRPNSPKSFLYLVDRYPKKREYCRHCGMPPEHCMCDSWDSVLCDTCFQSPCVCEEET